MNFRVVQIFNTWCFPYGNDKARIQTVLVRKGKPSSFNQTGLHHQDGYVSPLESDFRFQVSFITMIHVRATFRSNNSLKFPTLSIWTTQHLRLLSLWKDLLNLIPTSSWSSNVLHVVFTPLPLSARGLNLPPNLQKGVFYIKNKLKSEIFNDKTSL